MTEWPGDTVFLCQNCNKRYKHEQSTFLFRLRDAKKFCKTDATTFCEPECKILWTTRKGEYPRVTAEIPLGEAWQLCTLGTVTVVGPVYRIKKLAWDKFEPAPSGVVEWWQASSPFGVLNAQLRLRGDTQVCSWWRFSGGDFVDETSCQSLTEAKEKAEKWYLGKLLSALEEAR